MKILKMTMVLFLLLPIITSAASVSYFEFNPDSFKTQSINVSSTGPLYQVFLPVNEFFGGFDFWFDNTGDSGDVSFGLYNKNDILIASKALAVKHINHIDGGQRVHVDWDSQLSVNGSEKYKIKIESTLPELEIYYADRIEFLGHNAPYSTSYLNGAAIVGGDEREYSFKFSLYESVEHIPPVISGANVTILSYDQARLDFHANEPVDYRVDYGLSGQVSNLYVPFTGQYNYCNQGIGVCSIFLDINPNSNYQYILIVKDVWNNQSQATGVFNSQSVSTPTPTGTPVQSISPTPVIDNTPPQISNVLSSNIGDKGVDISWETNEAADSNLVISFTTNKITIAAANDTTLELLHLLKIENKLNPRTHYFASVISRDSFNNVASQTIEFTTLALGQNSPTPTPSPGASPTVSPQATGSPNPQNQTSTPSGQPQSTLGVTANQSEENKNEITVSWASDHADPSNGYRVDVFDGNNKLIKTTLVDSKTHSANIGELGKGDKIVIVYANNNGVYEKIAPPVRTIISDPPFIQRLLALWYLLIIPTVLIIGLLVWKLLLAKKTIVKPAQ